MKRPWDLKSRIALGVLGGLLLAFFLGQAAMAATITAEPQYTAGTSNTVFWTEPALGAWAYEVQRATNSDFTSSVQTYTVDDSETQYTFSGLLSGMRYYFRVRALVSVNPVTGAEIWEDWSDCNITSSTQDNTSPSTPVMDSEPAYTIDLTNTVNWSGATDTGSGMAGGQAGYWVYRATNADFTTGLIGSGWLSPSTLSYTFTGLASGQEYYYRVMARDNAGKIGDLSAAVSSTQDDTPPSAPVMAAEPAYTPGITNTVSWAEATDAGSGMTGGQAGYQAQSATNAGFTTDVVNSSWLSPSTLSCGFGAGSGARVYYYRVRARDALGNVGDWSAYVSSFHDSGPPSAPVMAAEPAYTAGLINTVSWEAATDAGSGMTGGQAGYYVRRATNADFTSGLADSGWLSPSTLSYTFPGLTDGQEYYYRVMARDTAGNVGFWSEYVSSTQDNTPPSTPVMTAEPPYTAGSTNTVSWTASTDTGSGMTGGTAGYRVMRARNASFTSDVVSVVLLSPSTLSYEFTGLAGGQTYYYHVLAIDNAGKVGSWSETVSSTQDTAGPEITGFQPAVWQVSGTDVQISVQVTDGPAVASVTISVDGAPAVAMSSTDGLHWTYTAPSLADGIHEAAITAQNSLGLVNTETFELRIDTHAPSAPGTPAPSATPTNDATPAWTWTAATDATSGVADYRVTLKDSEDAVVFQDYIGSDIPTWTVPDDRALASGTYTLIVEAKDAAGLHSVPSPAGTVTIDLVPPALTLIAPISGAEDRVTINEASTILVQGADVVSATFRINGGDPIDAKILAGNVIFCFIQSLPAGDFTVTITAYDALGNEATLEIEVYVDGYREGFGFGRFRFPGTPQ